MNNNYKTIEYKGYTIKIKPDTDPESPRAWDNMGIMACKHSRYDLGDVSEKLPEFYTDEQGHEQYFNAWSEVREWLIREKDIAIILPLGLYDHSGISMYIGSQHDKWDGGQVGFIYVTKAKLREEYGVKRITKEIYAKAEQILRSEVEVYDNFLTGQVFGYVIDSKDEKNIDSCWGFNGGVDDCMNEAKGVVDCLKAQEPKAKDKSILGRMAVR